MYICTYGLYTSTCTLFCIVEVAASPTLLAIIRGVFERAASPVFDGRDSFYQAKRFKNRGWRVRGGPSSASAVGPSRKELIRLTYSHLGPFFPWIYRVGVEPSKRGNKKSTCIQVLHSDVFGLDTDNLADTPVCDLITSASVWSVLDWWLFICWRVSLRYCSGVCRVI